MKSELADVYEQIRRDLERLEKNERKVPMKELTGKYRRTYYELKNRLFDNFNRVLPNIVFTSVPIELFQDEELLALLKESEEIVAEKKAFITNAYSEMMRNYDLQNAIDLILTEVTDPIYKNVFVKYFNKHTYSVNGISRNDLIKGCEWSGGSWVKTDEDGRIQLYAYPAPCNTEKKAS